MICKHCGAEIRNNAPICYTCGKPIEGYTDNKTPESHSYIRHKPVIKPKSKSPTYIWYRCLQLLPLIWFFAITSCIIINYTSPFLLSFYPVFLVLPSFLAYWFLEIILIKLDIKQINKITGKEIRFDLFRNPITRKRKTDTYLKFRKTIIPETTKWPFILSLTISILSLVALMYFPIVFEDKFSSDITDARKEPKHQRVDRNYFDPELVPLYYPLLSDIKKTTLSKNSDLSDNQQLSHVYEKCIGKTPCRYIFADLNSDRIPELILFSNIIIKNINTKSENEFSDIAMIYTLKNNHPVLLYEGDKLNYTVRRKAGNFSFISNNIAKSISICDFVIGPVSYDTYLKTGCHTSVCEANDIKSCSYYLEKYQNGKLEEFKDITAAEYETAYHQFFDLNNSQEKKNMLMNGKTVIEFDPGK